MGFVKSLLHIKGDCFHLRPSQKYELSFVKACQDKFGHAFHKPFSLSMLCACFKGVIGSEFNIEEGADDDMQRIYQSRTQWSFWLIF